MSPHRWLALRLVVVACGFGCACTCAPGGSNDAGHADSDCDGIADIDETSGRLGCVTDPLNADSDGDGLSDGIEEKAFPPGADPACAYTAASFDADPSSATNACSADTDGDGIPDGVEDSNHNGAVDPGEVDPNVPNDATTPAGQVCPASKLRPVVFHKSQTANLQVAVTAAFDPANGGQLTPITVAGVERGLMGYNPSAQVAFIAFTEAARGGSTTPTGDEAALNAVLDNVAALSNATAQTFATWDGYQAVQALYDQAGTADLIARANALANAVLGAGAGSLTGTSISATGFKLQAEYVHRSDQQVAVIIAVTPLTGFVEPAIFVSRDTAGGSALAAFNDGTGVQCETFTVAGAKVDFVFSVDDSTSMGGYQQALADVAAAAAQQLNNSMLDWRIAMVTTSYLAATLANSNHGVRRGFTRDINQFKAWLTQNSDCGVGNTCTLVTPAPACDSNGAPADGRNGGCWIGAGGTGNVSGEAVLGAARKGLDDISPPSATEQIDKARADADVVVVLVGDADDQSTGYATSAGNCIGNGTCVTVNEYTKFFTNSGSTPMLDKNSLGKRIVVHGIACRDGENCGETVANPRRWAQVVAGTGGVAGSIRTTASIQTTMAAIIDSAIASSGHKLQRPPIGASIKVAVGDVQGPGCTKDDVPRSRVNGFDFDGVNRSISLFGTCRPPAVSTQAAVSYRYWSGQAQACVRVGQACASDPECCTGLYCSDASGAGCSGEACTCQVIIN